MEKFPTRFKERVQALVSTDQVGAYLEHCTEPLPKTIRLVAPFGKESNSTFGESGDLNPSALQTSPLNKTNLPAGWTLSPTAVPEGFFIDRDNQSDLPLGKTLQHFTGQIYSQSLSSMLPVAVLNPQKDDKILDLCAAPGSKTSFLAERMEHTGVVVANEPSGSRAKKLAANLDRMKCVNTVVIQSDGTILNNFFAQEFDKILLDAPCSSEGYGRRDSKFFASMWSEPKIFMAAKLQKRLIESAWEMLIPGGVMVYSTCTSAPEENEAVVQHLLDTYPDSVEILPTGLEVPHAPGLTEWEGQKFNPAITAHSQRFYPHLRHKTWNSESFFVCKLHKVEPLKRLPPKKPAYTADVKFYKKNQAAEIATKIAKQFGLPKTWPNLLSTGKPAFYLKQNELYLTTPEGARFMQHNLFRRAGLRVMDKDQNLTTEIAMPLATHATKNVIELDAKQTQRWLEGYDLDLREIKSPVPPLKKGAENTFKNGTAVLVRHKNFGLGWGKVVNGKIKNKLDRSLVF